MAEFVNFRGDYTAAGVGVYGNFPQPPSYGMNPPPYSEASPPYPSEFQRGGTHAPTGYQSNYPSCAPGPPSMPYPQYSTFPTAAQQPYVPPQYADYQKAPPASSMVYSQQITYAAAPPPMLPYFGNQHHSTSRYVVNQMYPATPVVLMQSDGAATRNYITSDYPTTTIIKNHQQSPKSLTKEIATSVLFKVAQHVINPKPRDKGTQVTVITGGGGNMIVRK